MAPLLGRLGNGGGTTAGFGFGRRKGAIGAPAVWTRIVNQAGSYPGNTTGSFSVDGYVELLIFGVAGGGGGGAGGDDDGGGGGGGGSGQFTGYPILLSVYPGPYTYSIPGGGAPSSSVGGPGGPSPALNVSNPSGVIFSLVGGSGATSTPNNTTGNQEGAGAPAPAYASHAGGTGNVIRGRVVDNTPGNGTNGAYGGAGGGGAGIWAGPTTIGNPGLNNTVSSTVTTFGGYPLTTPFQVSGTNGGSGTDRTGDGGSPTGSPNDPALGGTSGFYNGGGGAGGGVRFFGTGNGGYGAGGGGGAAQGNTTSGRGGAGYLVVYAR